MRQNRLLETFVSALGTFVLTLALVLPTTLDAVSQPPATTPITAIPIPKLNINGIELTVKSAGPTTAPSKDGLAATEPIHLIVQARNVSLSPASADFTVQVTASSPESFASRTMSTPTEIWKTSDSIALDTGETKTVSITTCALPKDKMVYVNLNTDKQGLIVYFTSTTTQPSNAF